MKFLGGKARIARRLMDAITLYAPDKTKWVEPFVGGAWMLEAADKAGQFDTLKAGDIHPDLIMLYEAVAGGWEPPRNVTREDHIREKLAEPSPMRALVGFGSSFAGDWFAGYCGDRINSASSFTNSELAANHLARRRDVFARTQFRCADYRRWESDIDSSTVLYCDPPYVDTRPYKGRPPFETAPFWEWCRDMADRGAAVFVSEYGGGPDFAEVIWEREAKQTAGRTSNHTRIERLYQIKEPAIATSSNKRPDE